MFQFDSIDEPREQWSMKSKERLRRRAIMFVDMVGSTERKQQQGLVEALWYVRKHNRTVRDVVSSAVSSLGHDEESVPHGYIVKYIGDEVMVSFHAPDYVPLLIDCAVQIMRAFEEIGRDFGDLHIQAKAGIAVGDVIPFNHDDRPGMPDPHGSPVDLAARLVAMASPGQILINKECRLAAEVSPLHNGVSALSHMMPALPGIPKSLKGFREPIFVSQVVWNPYVHTQIRNLPLLRAQLKLIEEILSNMVFALQYLPEEIRRNLADLDPITGYRLAQNALRRFGGDHPFSHMGRLRTVIGETLEIQGEPLLIDHYEEVQRAYARAAELFDTKREALISGVGGDRAVAVADCNEACDRIFERIIGFHVATDTFMKTIDNGSVVKQRERRMQS